jgi:hypothetical protein
MVVIVPADQADAVCRAVAEWRGGGDLDLGDGGASGPSDPTAAAARSELAPLAALAQPPGRAWVIGEVVKDPEHPVVIVGREGTEL